MQREKEDIGAPRLDSGVTHEEAKDFRRFSEERLTPSSLAQGQGGKKEEKKIPLG